MLANELFGCISSLRMLVAGIVLLSLGYSFVLADLFRFSQKEELYSHVLMVPLITGYLVWIQRLDLAVRKWAWTRTSIISTIMGGMVLGAYCIGMSQGWRPVVDDRLSLLVLSYVCFLFSLCHAAGGKENGGRLAFPLGMLFFMVPMPLFLSHGLTVFLQVTSADLSYWLISLTGTPIHRSGLIFNLPGLDVEVAEECSGIRATYVLFITSLLAGYMFLARPSGKWWMAAAVIPIGILRNGIRILTISWLSVHVSHDVGIDGIIHHRGGPLFFAISLVPLFFLLVSLRKIERKRATPTRLTAGTARSEVINRR